MYVKLLVREEEMVHPFPVTMSQGKNERDSSIMLNKTFLRYFYISLEKA